MDLPLDDVPRPDSDVEPEGFVVVQEPGVRVHFLDWRGPSATSGVLLVHGLSQTGWIWTPVARRLRAVARVVTMDLRGHGLSDAPTDDPETEYALDVLADDVIAVAEGSGLLAPPDDRIVLAGHGFGAIVATGAALALGDACRGLVLVDGGWESLERASGLDVDEFLRGLDEPPEVLASPEAFLADRAAFDPASWDADQERAARATFVETHAGRVVPSTRPHALEACVRAMFEYDPLLVLPEVEAPIVVLAAADDETGSRTQALERVGAARAAAGGAPIRRMAFPHDGHNLMRYRPDAVTAAILSLGAVAGSAPR